MCNFLICMYENQRSRNLWDDLTEIEAEFDIASNFVKENIVYEARIPEPRGGKIC